ncbi:MAG: hypothetical protein K8S54_10625 [Spirochaetia bacterium]|nr:hypothetical protein [Spirochaetia bacterium]
MIALVLSLVGVLACIFLAPIQSHIWNAETSPPLVRLASANIQAFLEFRAGVFAESSNYYFFGRLCILVYVGLLSGLFYLRKVSPMAQIARREFQAMIAVTAIAACGNVLAYWVAGFYGEIFRTIGFRWIEAPALFGIMIVSLLLGRKLLKNRDERVIGAWFVALPLLMICSAVLFKYLPHGPLLPFSLLVCGLMVGSSSSLSWLEKIPERFQSARSIFVLFVVAMVCAGMMQILEGRIGVGQAAAVPLKLDFRPYSTITDLTQVFDAYGTSGRTLYVWINLVDMIFPIPLSLCIGAVAMRFCSAVGLPARIGLIPLGFLVFDVLENSLMLVHLSAYPHMNATLAAVTGVFTGVKLMFLAVSYAMFLIGLVGLALVGLMGKRVGVSNQGQV